MARITPLRRRLIDDMTVRNLSPATQQSYVYAVAKFSRFFGQSPDQLGVEEVRAYQIHLVGQGLSWSHINQVSCALRFFFGVTLGRQAAIDHIVRAREPRKLPIVLSGEEIARFLEAVPGLRSRAALTTAYGAGLRVPEVAALKIVDLDSSRMVIRVEHGKGGKSRYAHFQAVGAGMLVPLQRSPQARDETYGTKCGRGGCRSFNVARRRGMRHPGWLPSPIWSRLQRSPQTRDETAVGAGVVADEVAST